MDKISIGKPQQAAATGSSSLLSQVTLFFESNESIDDARKKLGLKQSAAKN